MSWWSKLFGGKPTPETRPPTYDELIAKVGDLEDRLDRERQEAASRKQKLTSRMRDDRAILARYREALEFYANEQSWRAQGLSAITPASSDRGHKARKALGRL